MDYHSPKLNEAILYGVSLCAGSQDTAEYEATLSPDELSRANRFALPELRQRYVHCRGALRHILGNTLGKRPSDLVFRYEQWGKPQLQTADTLALQFNVSHSRDQALIAVANSPIGVDLEFVDQRFNLRTIMSQVLSESERKAWKDLPGKIREPSMLQMWVCKEALLKAMGLGIAEGLQQVSYELPLPADRPFSPQHIDPNLQLHLDDDGTCRMNSWTDARAWRLRLLDLGPNCIGAMACGPGIQEITHMETDGLAL